MVEIMELLLHLAAVVAVQAVQDRVDQTQLMVEQEFVYQQLSKIPHQHLDP
jgi:hypothetical protein